MKTEKFCYLVAIPDEILSIKSSTKQAIAECERYREKTGNVAVVFPVSYSVLKAHFIHF